MSARQYPVCLDVDGKRCLVVGGGRVAARKVRELERCGARVDVVAPELCEEIETLAAKEAIGVERRGFVASDVLGAMIVVAATDEREINVAVRDACRAAGVLVNVADVPDLCDFTLPALLRRGRLTVAVSTAGASPVLSGRVRDEISRAIGPEWDEALEEISDFRQLVLERLSGDPAARSEILGALKKIDVASIVRTDGRAALSERLHAVLSTVLDGGDP